MQNFNFPRIKQTEVIDSFEGNKEHQEMLATERANELIVSRMIEMAKGSVAKEIKEEVERFEDGAESEDEAEREERTAVKSPSMMRMACNIMEVIRLREELIERIDETNVLTKIYLE